MRTKLLTLALVSACAAFATEAPRAQRPSSWQLAPAPAVPPSSVNHRGKILWFVESGTLHAFSAATRSWTSTAVSGAASIRNTNDWLLVQDGSAITAFSSARGRFETCPASAQAIVVNSPTGRNDGILLVLDGTTLWSFTGFTGRWASRTIPSTALITVQRNVAIVADGTSLWGLSALFGTWMPHSMSGIVSAVGVGDTMGWATDGVDAHGFSAIRNRWASAALPQSAQNVPTAERDVAVWNGPFEVLGFSGVRGEFDRAVTGIPTTIDSSDHFAHAHSADNRSHWMFSVPLALWTPLSTTHPATAMYGEATMLLLEPTEIHAYSALGASVATLSMANASVAVNATVAAALEPSTRDLRVYSALTGAWHTAPQRALRTLPQLARNGALLTDGGSQAWAFSTRSGGFFPHTLGATPTLHVDSGSSLMATEDDTSFAVFEPRREVWVDTPITASARPLTVRIWRTTLVALSATEGIGFSALHGTLERISLPGTLTDSRASSEVGAAITSGGVVAWSAVPDLRTEAQFPEFRRMYGRGSLLELEATGPAASAFGTVAGYARAQATPIPSLGELTLDPASLIPLAVGSLDAAGLATIPLPVPDVSTLIGIELGFQGVVLRPTGSPYLTRMPTFRIH